VSDEPPTPEVRVGLIVNPASGHDMRRLVSGASIATNTEKVAVVRRLLGGLGAAGVDRVLVMPDATGLSLGIERAVDGHRPERDGRWPEVTFVDVAVTHTVADTRAATTAMVERAVGAVVVLGGDGTARAVAGCLGDTPLSALSTGTNNAFGVTTEATVVGLAVGLVATGRCGPGESCRRAKQLDVRIGDRCELALVDVALVDEQGVGARAIRDVRSVRELAVTFAAPTAIGLSAIAAAVAPCERDEPNGRHVVLGGSGRPVRVPIAPGLVRTVGVAETSLLEPGRPRRLDGRRGVLAIDGEREIVLGPDAPSVTVELSTDGPLVIDVPWVLRIAAERSLLTG
jgi:predicted polyphosphate/ATP-dependent NAD kinase